MEKQSFSQGKLTKYSSRYERLSGNYFPYFSVKTYVVDTHLRGPWSATVNEFSQHVFVKK